MATEAELRAAAYLVSAEVENAYAAATLIGRGAPYTTFPTDAWQQTRLLLADLLDWEEWTTLAEVYLAVHGYNWRVRAGVLDTSGDKEHVLNRVLGARSRAAIALDRLADLAGAE